MRGHDERAEARRQAGHHSFVHFLPAPARRHSRSHLIRYSMQCALEHSYTKSAIFVECGMWIGLKGCERRGPGWAPLEARDTRAVPVCRRTAADSHASSRLSGPLCGRGPLPLRKAHLHVHRLYRRAAASRSPQSQQLTAPTIRISARARHRTQAIHTRSSHWHSAIGDRRFFRPAHPLCSAAHPV